MEICDSASGSRLISATDSSIFEFWVQCFVDSYVILNTILAVNRTKQSDFGFGDVDDAIFVIKPKLRFGSGQPVKELKLRTLAQLLGCSRKWRRMILYFCHLKIIEELLLLQLEVAVSQMDLVIFIVDVMKYVGAPTHRYVSSYRKLERNMKTLNDTLQDLNSKRSDLEQQVEVELSLFKMQKEEVKIWEKRVDVMNNEVKKIEEKVRKHNYLSRARLGRHVEEKILEVKELLQRAVSFSTLVIDRPPAKGVILPTQQLVGHTSVVGNIFAQLIGDEVGNAGIIGVCGVKGIGKTIIVKHINNKLVREITTRGNKFGKVIWVAGTHKGDEFNVMKFQNDVAADLLGDKYDNNQKLLPDPEERDRRAGKVTQMLEASKGSIVIILDDVWKPFSLSDAGVSEPIAHGKCKLLITSRSEELCWSMGCQVVETVTPLPKNDALALFSQRSGLEHLMAVPVVARIIIEVVEECGGMPTQILSLASEMKGVNDVREWRRKRMERKNEAFEGNRGEGEAALIAFMRRYDKDGDGRLSKLELKEAFKEMGSNNPTWKAVRALRHADTNRDGFIDGKELQRFIGYVNRSFSMDIN